MLRNGSVLILLLAVSPAFNQDRIAAPSLEVADVKVNKSGDVCMAVDFEPGGRFYARFSIIVRASKGCSH